jgi:hypothetical protein
MGNGRFNVAVSFGTHPELRSPVTALSLGGLRRRIEIALLPKINVEIRLDSSADDYLGRHAAAWQPAISPSSG